MKLCNLVFDVAGSPELAKAISSRLGDLGLKFITASERPVNSVLVDCCGVVYNKNKKVGFYTGYSLTTLLDLYDKPQTHFITHEWARDRSLK